MRKINVRNIIFSLLFILAIIMVGILVILKKPEAISFIENRVLNHFKAPTVETVMDGSFQENTENSFADQFLYRKELFQIMDKTNNLLRAAIRFGVGEDSMTLVSISDNGIFKVGPHGSTLVEFPFMKTDEQDAQLMARIDNYNAIAEKYPDIKFYIYRVTNARDTSWFDEANEIWSSGSHYSQWLQDNINPSITYQELQFENYESYKKETYKTDHHLNVFGNYRFYEEIIAMLQKDFSLENPKEPIDMFEAPVKFYGSLVKKANFNFDDKVYDVVSDFVYELAPCKVQVNGEEVKEFGRRQEYMHHQNIDETKGTNHYRELFGKDSFEVIYECGNSNGINALIISDSYTNAIKPVLSSHFNKAIYIDPRQPSLDGDYFNMKNYIEQHDINLVLFVGSYYTVYMDEPYLIAYY